MRVAIIGGLGSGKSEVLKIAKEKGFFCLSADEINANLLVSPSYIAKIAAAFPTVEKDGAVDKKALASIVFSDDERLETLNAIAHPEIAKVINECAEPLVAAELPIVLESVIGGFDEILFVSTPYQTRLKRLKGRGLDTEQAKARIHRAGQKENCHYIYLICRDTVDGKVLDALRKKQDLARMLVDDYRKGWNPFANVSAQNPDS